MGGQHTPTSAVNGQHAACSSAREEGNPGGSWRNSGKIRLGEWSGYERGPGLLQGVTRGT